MIKETPFHAHNPERSESTCDSRVKTYKTAAGSLFLRTCCPPALVEGLQVEVSSTFRNLGIAHQLLSQALDFESVEKHLVVGLGLSWHWDYTWLGMPPFQYRELIARLFAAHGFAEYMTSEPNIRMDPANILVARFGRHLGEGSMNRFFERLFQSERLPGL